MQSKKYILCMIFLIWLSSLISSYGSDSTYRYEKVRAEVLKEDIIQENQRQVQIVTARILEGKFSGGIVEFTNQLIDGSANNIELQNNMKVFLTIQSRDDEVIGVNFIDIARDFHLKMLFLLFVALLILFGGFKGMRSFIALVITAVCIIYVFIPLVLKGYNFIITTIIVSSIIVISSFILITGFSTKSLSAILGTIGGTMVSGITAIYFGKKIQLTGVADEMMELLVAYSTYSIDYRGLLYSGIIIGALGAVMDVSMTITSVVYEIKGKTPNIRIRSLFFSGLSVGRDIMATMTNTLILAYVGTSLPLLLIFIFSDMAIVDIVNSQYISSEIVRSLCGSIGLILTIPITSIVAAINT